jgi:hypothetical protein
MAHDIAADLGRLIDLMAGRILPGLPPRRRRRLATIHARTIRLRHEAGVYPVAHDAVPGAAAGGTEVAP